MPPPCCAAVPEIAVRLDTTNCLVRPSSRVAVPLSARQFFDVSVNVKGQAASVVY